MSGKRRKGGQKKKQEKHKKTPRKFAYLRISCYLCTRKTETGTFQYYQKDKQRSLLRCNRALSSVGSERLPYKQRVGGSNPSAPTRGVSRDLFGGCGNFFCYSPCPVFSAKLCRTLHPRIRNASHQCPLDINGWRHFICTKLRAQCQAGARRINVRRMSRLAV